MEIVSKRPSLLSLVTTDPSWGRVGQPCVAFRTIWDLSTPNKEVGGDEDKTFKNEGEVGDADEAKI